MDGTKWAWAFLLACPACTGGTFLAIAGAAGIGAGLLRSAALAMVGATLLALLLINAYRRRGEGCPLPGRGAG